MSEYKLHKKTLLSQITFILWLLHNEIEINMYVRLFHLSICNAKHKIH